MKETNRCILFINVDGQDDNISSNLITTKTEDWYEEVDESLNSNFEHYFEIKPTTKNIAGIKKFVKLLEANQK